MHDREALCEKIRKIYPDIGECGIDLKVDWDEKQKAYVVHLKKGSYDLKHFLEAEDADLCMGAKQCVRLGIEIAQWRANVERSGPVGV